MNLVIKDIVLTLLMVLAAVGAMYLQYFSEVVLQQYSMYAWGAACISLGMFLRFATGGQDFVSYAKAAKQEMRKVVWPNRDDIVSTTVAVGIAVIIFSILVSFLDSLLVKFLAYIIG